jgi:hypothetical protein
MLGKELENAAKTGEQIKPPLTAKSACTAAVFRENIPLAISFRF